MKVTEEQLYGTSLLSRDHGFLLEFTLTVETWIQSREGKCPFQPQRKAELLTFNAI